MISQGFRDSLKGRSVQRWDPRPDLVEDHDLVELVLQCCLDLRQKRAFSLIQACRCEGLRIRRDASTKTGLRLIWDDVRLWYAELGREVQGRAAVVPTYIDGSAPAANTPAGELARALDAVLRKAASRLRPEVG